MLLKDGSGTKPAARLPDCLYSSLLASCSLLLVTTSCPLLLVISPLTRSPCCKRGRRIRLWLVIEAMCQRQPKDKNWISHDFIIIFSTDAMCFLTDWVFMKCALCSVSRAKRTSLFTKAPMFDVPPGLGLEGTQYWSHHVMLHRYQKAIIVPSSAIGEFELQLGPRNPRVGQVLLPQIDQILLFLYHSDWTF